LRAVSARDGASGVVIIRLGKAFKLLDHGSQISCVRDNRINAARLAEISFESSQGLRRQNALTHRPRAQRFASPTSNRHDQKFPFLRIPRMGMASRLKQLRRELWLRCVALRHLARQQRLECECLARSELWRRLMFHDSAHRARTVSQSVLRTAQTMMRYASQSGIRAAPDMVRPPPVKRAEPAAGSSPRV
jgi:hypothetical protein